MGILSKLASFKERSSFTARQMDSELQAPIYDYKAEGKLVKVKPYPDNPGLQGSVELLEALHNVKKEGRFREKNVSPVHSFEIWYDENKIQFVFYIKGDETETRKFLKQLNAHFENADVSEVEDAEFHFPQIKENEWVAGGRFHLKHHYFEPIRHKGGVENIREPYKPITNDMVSKSETRMVMQVCFKPAMYGWTKTYFEDVKAYAEKIEGQRYVSEWFGTKGDYVSPPGPVRSAASNMKNQSGKPGYHINVRILAIGPTKEQTERQCKSVSEIFQQKFYEPPGQTLVATPAKKSEMPNLLNDFINRKGHTMAHPRHNVIRAIREKSNKWTGRPYRTMIMSIPEVAGLAHLPNNNIKNGAVNWSMTDTSGSLPAEAPTFEDILRDHGFEPKNKSAAEKSNASKMKDNTKNSTQEKNKHQQKKKKQQVAETEQNESESRTQKSPSDTNKKDKKEKKRKKKKVSQSVPTSNETELDAQEDSDTDEKINEAIEDPLDIALRY